jgi:hypothetical protein
LDVIAADLDIDGQRLPGTVTAAGATSSCTRSRPDRKKVRTEAIGAAVAARATGTPTAASAARATLAARTAIRTLHERPFRRRSTAGLLTGPTVRICSEPIFVPRLLDGLTKILLSTRACVST